MVNVVEHFGCRHVNGRAMFVKMKDVEVLFCCVDVRLKSSPGRRANLKDGHNFWLPVLIQFIEAERARGQN